MVALAGVADVEAVGGFTVPASDTARVARLLELASDKVRGYCRQTISAVAADVVTLTAPADRDLWLPEAPVTAVTSITSNGITVPPADYRVFRSGRVQRTSLWSWWEDYQPTTLVVTNDHGYTTIPNPVVEVVCDLAITRYKRPVQAHGGIQNLNLDGFAVGFSDMVLTETHEAALNAYRVPFDAEVRL